MLHAPYLLAHERHSEYDTAIKVNYHDTIPGPVALLLGWTHITHHIEELSLSVLCLDF